MRLKRNDKGEFEEANDIHVTPELLILSKLGSIEEKLQLISSKLDLEEKADYENSLKDDKVAMLVRLNNEIDDLRAYDDIETVDKCEEIIQKEIDKLKEDNNESY